MTVNQVQFQREITACSIPVGFFLAKGTGLQNKEIYRSTTVSTNQQNVNIL